MQHPVSSVWITTSIPISPNADEALALLSMEVPVTRGAVEEAGSKFLDLGIGADGMGTVIIRSGSLGAYVASRERLGRWVEAFWTPSDADKVVDVTGASGSLCVRDELLKRCYPRCRKCVLGGSCCRSIVHQGCFRG